MAERGLERLQWQVQRCGRGRSCEYPRPARPQKFSTGVGEEAIPVVEEKLRIGKRQVGGGRLKVRSYVVETPVSEQVSLRTEKVHVERRPADRAIKAGEDAFRERTIEAQASSEEAVVSKEARVTGEVVVKKECRATGPRPCPTPSARPQVDVEDERTNVAGKGTTDKTRTDPKRRWRLRTQLTAPWQDVARVESARVKQRSEVGGGFNASRF